MCIIGEWGVLLFMLNAIVTVASGAYVEHNEFSYTPSNCCWEIFVFLQFLNEYRLYLNCIIYYVTHKN